MKPTPDLHTHSTASDGTLSPTELLQRAASAGVEVLALTDHDTTDGLSEASVAARQVGVHLIPGVEISVTWGGRTIHVVGLHLDPAAPALQAGLDRLMAFRAWRAEEIGRRLAKRGIEGAYEGAKALSNGKLIGRTHFARFLVSRRLAADTGDVFKRFLTTGKPGHVSGQWATLEEAVTWIRGAGGQAVIAHPARYKQTRTRMQALLGEFRELGGAGVEVLSGSHSRDDAFTFARHAREQRLMASAGSDYHGPESPWVELGRLARLPDGCAPIWRDWPEMAESAPALRAAAG
ncbi:PHP domain-containing protein [Thiorhodococcus minor]|uniref:PHP domain-containing protein n=1 Tax=Thiorhodococcus minor TaxID=57489 RepID=A0A6M0K677_9GAMM|nr:PHP domain-containing protein [Thiorhodococcus minor]NEV64811.1 PHP domain-containing protein [Thiorhodococcus minor]